MINLVSKLLIILFFVWTLLNNFSCAPRLKHFPKFIDSVQFERFAKVNLTPASKIWELETSKEYYLETNEYIDEERLVKVIKKSLKKEGYRIVKKKGFINCIIGKKNFFNRSIDKTRTIACVYYQSMPNKFRSQVFIKFKMNKDNKNLISYPLGGKVKFSQNRAKDIGEEIKKNLGEIKWKLHF